MVAIVSRPWKETAEDKRRRDASMAIDRVIAEQVADVDPDAFEERQPWPAAEECWGTKRAPLALPAITAARRVMFEAQKAEREAIEHARGQGKTWTEIGKALGEPFVKAAIRADMALSLAAWRYAAFRVLPDEEIPWRWSGGKEGARWRCWTCAQHVTEGHPDNGPDAEEGHAPGCVRLAARRRRGYR